MGLLDLVPDDLLDVDGGLAEQVLGEGTDDGVTVRGHRDAGEGGLGDGGGGAFREPGGGHAAGAHQREGTDEVAQDGGAELGDDHTVLQALNVAGSHLLLGVAAIGVGGVVLAGAGTEGGGREDEALLGQAKTLVLLGTHLGDVCLETGELALGGLTEELDDGEAPLGVLLQLGELLLGESLLGDLDLGRGVQLGGEIYGLLHGGVIGSLVGRSIHGPDGFDLGLEILADVCDFAHGWLEFLVIH